MSSHFFPRDEYFMHRLALREATRATEHDDIPVGAVVVRDGEVIGTGHNEREVRADPTAHAEMIALREAARALGTWRVLDSVLYVTLEPCTMCAGRDRARPESPGSCSATTDPKAGAAGSILDVMGERRLGHRPQVQSGLLAEECADLLRAFFARRVRGGAGGGRRAAVACAANPCLIAARRRGGRAVECAGLENRYGRFRPSRVRIPPSPLVVREYASTRAWPG